MTGAENKNTKVQKIIMPKIIKNNWTESFFSINSEN